MTALSLSADEYSITEDSVSEFSSDLLELNKEGGSAREGIEVGTKIEKDSLADFFITLSASRAPNNQHAPEPILSANAAAFAKKGKWRAV